MKLAITGGRARKTNSIKYGWTSTEAAILLIYDTEKKDVIGRFEYSNPDKNFVSDNPSILFKTCSIKDGTLYLCTKTEVLLYDLVSEKVVSRFSHPFMNDVHHVSCIDEKIYVVSTGLDSILEFSKEQNFERLIYLGNGDFQDNFSLETDYRRIESLKPHECHPNYIFSFEGNIYATRLHQKDCIDIIRKKPFPISESPIHDGVVRNGYVFFTSVDGKIIKSNLGSYKQVFDINLMDGDELPLGWCRGVLPIDDDLFIVGFSVLRNTKIKDNVKWVASKFGLSGKYTSKRTRLSLVDVRNNSVEDMVFLDDLGIDAVFGIVSLG